LTKALSSTTHRVLFSSHNLSVGTIITYSESSGQIGDPWDEVHVSIVPNGMEADWQNENNVLSDSNDNCGPMTLIVYVYPGYVGES